MNPLTAAATAAVGAVLVAVPLLLAPTQSPATAVTTTNAAATTSCLPAPAPGSADALAGIPNDKQQHEHAATIVRVARERNLPQRAAIIALATAYQETKFINYLYHTDGTSSLGLFAQMTIYYGYDVATDPAKSTGAFLDILVKQPNWETRPLTEVAADVQRPAAQYRDRYAQWEPLATNITAQLWGGGACTTSANSGTFGATTGGSFNLPRANPRSVDEAIAWMRRQEAQHTTGWHNRCLASVAQAYGWGYSGINYAIDAYRGMPAGMRHDGDRNPPPGALLFWDTGAGRPGHVALAVGNGQIASTDITIDGQISIVDAGLVESKWGSTYVGWAPPYFPKGGGSTP
jgi:hypothetical protein